MLGSLLKQLMLIRRASSSQPYFSSSRVTIILRVTPCRGSWLAGLFFSRSITTAFFFFDRLRLGLFYADLVARDILAVEGLYRRLGFARPGHLDEAKPLGASSLFVDDQGTGLHSTVGLEQSAEFGLCGGAGKIAY